MNPFKYYDLTLYYFTYGSFSSLTRLFGKSQRTSRIRLGSQETFHRPRLEHARKPIDVKHDRMRRRREMTVNIEHDARVVQIAQKIGCLLYEKWIRLDLLVRIESLRF